MGWVFFKTHGVHVVVTNTTLHTHTHSTHTHTQTQAMTSERDAAEKSLRQMFLKVAGNQRYIMLEDLQRILGPATVSE